MFHRTHKSRRLQTFIYIRCRSRGGISISWGKVAEGHHKKNLPATGQTVDAIFARCAELATKPLKILLKGSNFQIKVWDALLRIPAGCLTTYGNIAKVLGMSGAARAVGGAVGANPVAYLVPCHRVIRKLGAFGGYAYGPARKKAIIGWEMAQEAKRRGRTSTVY